MDKKSRYFTDYKQNWNMIDAHCHLDLYDDPHAICREVDKLGIKVISMTNLPSHYELGFEHVKQYKNIRLALGMHPLFAQHHNTEFSLFVKNINRTSYIGEVGLDFSKEGIATKEAQIKSFSRILAELKGKKKVLSIHSRQAERDVLRLLTQYNIKNAIFHWYSGPLSLIDLIVDAGFYFSVNHSMISSERGQNIIRRIPLERILTETDGPFIKYEGRIAKPSDLLVVENYLGILHKKSLPDISRLISQNFSKLLNFIRK